MRTSLSGCHHLHTDFLGVIISTQAYLHEQHFISMWHLWIPQEIELEYDKKLHLSNGKVLIMAEASSLGEFFLHRIYMLLKQNCKTNLCGNACATENVTLKFTIFVKISLFGCKNWYRSKQKYHCFLLKARG